VQHTDLTRAVGFLAAVATMVAVIGGVYLATGRGEPGGGGKVGAVPTAAMPTAEPQTRGVPIVSVRRGDDPRALVIEYGVGVGACDQTLGRTQISETSALVTVRLLPTSPTPPTPPPANCFDQVLLRTTIVRLTDPLGERRIIDGTTGATVKVEDQ